MAEDRHPDPADEPGPRDESSSAESASGEQASGDQTSGDQSGGPTPGEGVSDAKPQYRLGGNSQPASSSSGTGDPANPFEALFSSLGGGDMGALAEQLQSAFASLGGDSGMFGRAGGMFGATGDSTSGVNWEVTKDTARKTAAGLGADPTPDRRQRTEITEAVSLAETWLDQATTLPRVASTAAAWSRADWIEKTLPVWRRLVEPVAAHIADAMEGALKFGGSEETGLPGMAGMEQMLRPMLRSSGASMFGMQLGQGLGQLAGEVVGVTDIGLPLSEDGQVALLPTNVAAFGEGLDQSSSDVTLYLALRECARQRLFASAGWLRTQVLTLVEQYAAGITIDTSALEEAVGQLDPTNLSELGATLEGGLFEPQKTPEQRATLERLETMLALVEGWVDEVVGQATAPWMPAAAALAETVRRRRATGGPAEATFATLVGLELRPRRMRDATNLWAALRDARGTDGRDAVWSHPDLVPTSSDLDDPLGFVATDDHQQVADDDDFDTALAELLDAEADGDGDGEHQGNVEKDGDDGDGDEPSRQTPQ